MLQLRILVGNILQGTLLSAYRIDFHIALAVHKQMWSYVKLKVKIKFLLLFSQ